MEEHPTPDEFHAFTAGSLSRERTQVLVTHLLHGCRTCREELERHNPMGPAWLQADRRPLPQLLRRSLPGSKPAKSAGGLSRRLPFPND